MVSRNEEKMKIKLEEVLSVCTKKVKTMYLVADFASMSTIQDYQRTIADKLKNIDIAMLFLNAGVI